MFFQRRQIQGESFESFLNFLRTEADKCDFRELKDRFICLQLIFGRHDKLVRDKLLLDPKITLDKAIDICLDAEASKIRKNNLDADSLRAVNESIKWFQFLALTDHKNIKETKLDQDKHLQTVNFVVAVTSQGNAQRTEKSVKNAVREIILRLYADQHHPKTCMKL